MSTMPEGGLVPARQVLNGRKDGNFVELPGAQSKQQDPAEPRLQVINLPDFVALPLPQRQHILKPIMPERGLAMLYAPRGVGKTLIAFNIAWAVACGQPYMRWYAPKPRKVLFVDGEMPAELLQERAQAMMAASACQPPHPDFFRDRAWAAERAAPFIHCRPAPDMRRVSLDLPDTSTAAGIGQAIDAVLKASASAQIAPAEARDLIAILEARMKAIGLVEIDERLRALEDQRQ